MAIFNSYVSLPEGTGKSQWENTIGYYDCIFQRDIFRQCDCPKMEVSQFENGNLTDYICLQPWKFRAAYLKTKQLRIWNSWSSWSTMVPEIGLSCSLPKKHQKTWGSFQVPARSQDIWTTWPLFFVQEKKWMRGPLFSLEPEAGPWIRITTYSLHVEDETFQALHIYVLHVYRQ
jgi:hypothetical protein